MLQLPPQILQWLKARTLSEETIQKFKIGWNGKEITIPIYDANGLFLFNKYRSDPTGATIGPKYKYDFGSTARLFNISTLKNADPNDLVMICEGELDVMAVENIGIRAISSTGGCKTFLNEWAHALNKFNHVFICYDNDEAGVYGAIKVQSMINTAQVIFLPRGEGKDVTEYLQKYGKEKFLLLKGENYSFIPPPEGTAKQFKEAADRLVVMQREALRTINPTYQFQMMLSYVLKNYELLKEEKKKKILRRKFPPAADLVDRVRMARERPISDFIKFVAGYAPCIFHNESTASMFYNKPTTKFPNTVHCFGCGRAEDSIGVVMHLNNLKFKDAVDFILK